MYKKMNVIVVSKRTVKYLLVYCTLILVLFPFVWMLLASFKNQKDILNPDKLFVFVPNISNYISVFVNYNFLKPMVNSFIVATCSTLLGLILGLPAAYSIARYSMNRLGIVILMVRMIPSIAFLIPWYTIFTMIGLTDTLTAMTLAHLLVALPFIIWVMEPAIESLPRDIEEAALVDGSYRFQTFFRIVIPLITPSIITASLLAFIFSWNNFMFSLVLSGARSETLPMALYSFMSYAAVDWGGLMAAATVITLPIIVISLFLQRYIIKGLTAGAVKG